MFKKIMLSNWGVGTVTGVAKIKNINCQEYEFSPLVSNFSSYYIIHNYLTTRSLPIRNI